MKSLVAILSVAGIALTAGAHAAIAGSHDLYFARVATYQPVQGFNHVIAGKRFTGFFVRGHDACAVSLIVSDADDETLKSAPQRMEFQLSSSQGVDVAASEREAIGIACTADADAVKVAKLTRPNARTVQRD